MPKSPTTPSPTSPTSNTKSSSDPVSRMSDVALRKKKNADAQAAFRARRANYIATLEETVTSLENVVIQLQESSRESRQEASDLRQENARLRLEARERERFWRALYQTRKPAQVSDSDDLSSPFPPHAPNGTIVSHSAGNLVQQQQHSYTAIGYRGDDPSNSQHGVYLAGAANSFSGHPPFAGAEPTVDGSSGPNRAGKYSNYPYSIQGSPRDARWPTTQTNMNTADSMTPPHSHSPTYIESPALASTDMTYNSNGRFPTEEQKVTLNTVLETAPYVFPNGDRYHQNLGDSVPNSRSMSPTSSTPGSSTSVSLTSSFPFPFPEHSAAGQDRADYDYRRQSLTHCPEVTLHGGTADISLTAQSSDVRYRMNRRLEGNVEHHSLVHGSENGSQHEQASNDGDPPFDGQRNRLRRSTISSRSPSPGPTPISCTVAVIKAQAFGALRRTRARTKKSSEGAAKVAMDVLEARGIGVGAPSATKRGLGLEEDDLEMETS